MRTMLLGASMLALAASASLAQAQTAEPATNVVAPGHFQVYFGFDESTLTPEARSVIADAAAEYRRTGSAQLTISGYADRAGSEDYNIGLSERRAQAVQEELIANGVPGSVLSTAAYGESDPAVETPDGVPEARNRRVLVVVPQAAPPAVAVADPAPMTPMEEPMAMTEEDTGLGFSIGPLYGWNFQEEDEGGTENNLVGAELKFDALPSFLGGLSLKQGILYSFNGHEGWNGRSLLSLDFAPDFGVFRPVVSLNGGGVYGEGVQDGFVVGPEIGLDFQIANFTIRPKVAYDYQFRNPQWDEGILWGGLDLGLRF